MASDKRHRIVTVFRSRLRPDAEANGYRELAQEMEARARSAPGFVDFKTFVAEDGERVSIIVFESLDDQAAWKRDPDHQEAQRRGRDHFYEAYSISVSEELRVSSFRAPIV